jgi:hypothetical protein
MNIRELIEKANQFNGVRTESIEALLGRSKKSKNEKRKKKQY